MNYSDERPLDTLMISVYPSTHAEALFTLYEDDGETLEYQSGSYSTTEFLQSTGETEGSSLTLAIGSTTGSYTGQPLHRVYLADVHLLAGNPSGVTKNGASVPAKISYEELRAGGDGYFYEAGRGVLYVQIPALPESAYVIVVQDVQVAAGGADEEIPSEISLAQNYPNPFNPTTAIRFEIGPARPNSVERSFGRSGGDVGFVTLCVYDLLGREVATLVDEKLSPGTYTRQWDATGQPSGVYFYRLVAGEFVETRKLVLLR
jgi:hypothetical protein